MAVTEELFLTVEELSLAGNPVRIIARADNVTVAQGAFVAACEALPNRWLRLRNRALVVAERKP